MNTNTTITIFFLVLVVFFFVIIFMLAYVIDQWNKKVETREIEMSEPTEKDKDLFNAVLGQTADQHLEEIGNKISQLNVSFSQLNKIFTQAKSNKIEKKDNQALLGDIDDVPRIPLEKRQALVNEQANNETTTSTNPDSISSTQ